MDVAADSRPSSLRSGGRLQLTASCCGVEVDGGYHARRGRADSRRDRVLTRAGYRVLRLEGELVMADLSRAVALIVEHLG